MLPVEETLHRKSPEKGPVTSNTSVLPLWSFSVPLWIFSLFLATSDLNITFVYNMNC